MAYDMLINWVKKQKGENKMYHGTWSTNHGNTWSDNIFSAKTEIGLLRILGRIIDGNLTGYHDVGIAKIWTGEKYPEYRNSREVRRWNSKWVRIE